MAVATITRKPLEHLAGGRPRVRLAIGKPADTVRLERALLSHLFTTAIKEWRLGLICNPVSSMRKPARLTHKPDDPARRAS